MTDTTPSSVERVSLSEAVRRKGGALRSAAEAVPVYVWAALALMLLPMLWVLAVLDWAQDWSRGLLVIATAGLIMSPTLVRHRLPVLMPPWLELSLAAFIYSCLFLGEVVGLYEAIWWWDMMLHTASGVLFGVVGLALAYGWGGLRLAPRLAFLFAVMFAMSVGTFWEFYEYAFEALTGIDMQTAKFGDGSGLTDTMLDMALNAIGAVGVAVHGWRATRPGRRSGAPAWIETFVAVNAAFFGRAADPPMRRG
ncbi:MAG TPA: hypothetical protein VGN97_03775 [Mesorhizobium sp.]|jgi:hypothetical protein|nr:hypothetical protein [Mesorhizobium sp.]